MKTQGLTDKLIILGVDGFDPSLAKKFMDMGHMPILKQFVERGAAREDLVLLGSMPTVTPPMWTTLATGATPVVHGITQFFNPHPEHLDMAIYGMDSRLCKAEPLWNVTAEAGKDTLVWHWPGSSWPPTSNSPHLAVVDGTQPGAINMGVAAVDWEKICVASTQLTEVKYFPKNGEQNAGVGCVITGLDDSIGDENAGGRDDEGKPSAQDLWNSPEFKFVNMYENDTEIEIIGKEDIDHSESPIKAAEGWANAPADAKEFVLLTANGYTRRPCLVLANEHGLYDKVAIYKTKKEVQPLITLECNQYYPQFVDEIKDKGENKLANRCLQLLELAPDGNYLRLWMSMACDVRKDLVWHPKALLEEINEKVGYLPPISQSSGSIPEFAQHLLLPSWDYYSQWQADCLTYLMDQGRYSVIFSHLHNIDLVGHQFWHYAKHRAEWGNDALFYQGCIQYSYEQTDRYLARFIDYLDKGWTIIITSDHGLITEENHPPLLNEMGVNIPVMRDLGYTTMIKDDNGNDTKDIDWQKTKAIATRSCYIYLNLVGRTDHGIVTLEEQYELEAEIISALYGYRDPRTGKRIVSIALRNRDAILLGMGGPECGDIIFFMEEGFDMIHADSLSTQRGYFDTSVSPIFIGAGQGFKTGCVTERIIRQADVAPTAAVLLGVRMPAQCEGAPAYQIIND